jgi:hypothetical protein
MSGVRLVAVAAPARLCADRFARTHDRLRALVPLGRSRRPKLRAGNQPRNDHPDGDRATAPANWKSTGVSSVQPASQRGRPAFSLFTLLLRHHLPFRPSANIGIESVERGAILFHVQNGTGPIVT